MKQLSRPQLITAGVVAAVVLGAGVTLAVGGGGSGSDNSGAKPGLEEAAAVVEALGNLANDPASLVASDVRSAIGGRAREAVQAGSTVSANPASWQPDGLGGGTITVTVTSPGQPAVTYTAVMVKETEGWKVVGTVPLNPSTAGSTPAEPGQAPAANPPGVAQVPPGGATIPSAGAGVVPPGAPGAQPGAPAQQPAAPGGGQ